MLYLCEAPEVTELPNTCEERVAEALAMIDHVARICGCTNPAHALALLKQSEQVRLYALLKGENE